LNLYSNRFLKKGEQKSGCVIKKIQLRINSGIEPEITSEVTHTIGIALVLLSFYSLENCRVCSCIL